MADLIDRRKLMKLFESLARHEDDFRQSVILGMVHTIKAVPAVDAVEVVRCKDCRWLYDYYDGYYCYRHKGLACVTPDSFCSYGERREENAAD